MNKIKIRTALIIDDDNSVAEILKEALEQEGIQVFHAEDGDVGLNLIQENCYDMIFTDVKMPGASWNEITKATKEKTVTTVMSGYIEGVKSNDGADFFVDKSTLSRALPEILAFIK